MAGSDEISRHGGLHLKVEPFFVTRRLSAASAHAGTPRVPYSDRATPLSLRPAHRRRRASLRERRHSRSRCRQWRSEEHTSELQSLMRISYAVFCLKKKKQNKQKQNLTIQV